MSFNLVSSTKYALRYFYMSPKPHQTYAYILENYKILNPTDRREVCNFIADKSDLNYAFLKFNSFHNNILSEDLSKFKSINQSQKDT